MDPGTLSIIRTDGTPIHCKELYIQIFALTVLTISLYCTCSSSESYMISKGSPSYITMRYMSKYHLDCYTVCTVCYLCVILIHSMVICAGQSDFLYSQRPVQCSKCNLSRAQSKRTRPKELHLIWNTCLPWFLHVPLQLWVKSIISLLLQTAEQMWSPNAF